MRGLDFLSGTKTIEAGAKLHGHLRIPYTASLLLQTALRPPLPLLISCLILNLRNALLLLVGLAVPPDDLFTLTGRGSITLRSCCDTLRHGLFSHLISLASFSSASQFSPLLVAFCNSSSSRKFVLASDLFRIDWCRSWICTFSLDTFVTFPPLVQCFVPFMPHHIKSLKLRRELLWNLRFRKHVVTLSYLLEHFLNFVFWRQKRL